MRPQLPTQACCRRRYGEVAASVVTCSTPPVFLLRISQRLIHANFFINGDMACRQFHPLPDRSGRIFICYPLTPFCNLVQIGVFIDGHTFFGTCKFSSLSPFFPRQWVLQRYNDAIFQRQICTLRPPPDTIIISASTNAMRECWPS